MDRRTWLGAVGGALALGAYAQAPARPLRVAFVEAGAASANAHFLAAFERGMRGLGYVPGRNLTIEPRWAEGRAENFPALLVAAARSGPDVIVVSSTQGAMAAKQAATTIPVVFVGASDPLGTGLVASLAHPGGTMTGLSRLFDEGLIGKQLQGLKEIVPRASRLAILWNADGSVEPRVREAEDAARALGMTPLPVPVRRPSDFAEAFAAMKRQRADAVTVITDPMTLRHRDAIIAQAAAQRLPAAYEFSEFARSGGLIAYSASIPALFERAAIYVDKIARGAKPGDLPVEQPTRYELVVNAKTAQALGLVVPRTLLERADEVIR